MTALLKTFAGLNFYTRTCFIDYYHISFKKSHQTLRPRSCRVNQNFDISWILDLGLYPHDGYADNAAYRHDCHLDKRHYLHDRETYI